MLGDPLFPLLSLGGVRNFYGTHAVAGVRELPGCSYGLTGQHRSRGCSRSALAAWHRAPTEMPLWAAGACEWRPTTWGGVDGRVCSADLIREADHSHSTNSGESDIPDKLSTYRFTTRVDSRMNFC